MEIVTVSNDAYKFSNAKIILLTLFCTFLGACGGGGEIGGNPLLVVDVGELYDFSPTSSLNDTKVFSIENKPAWATFDAQSGRLYGTPSSDDIGKHPDIVIKVAEAGGKSFSLNAFTITVWERTAVTFTTDRLQIAWGQSVQLTWSAIDGSEVSINQGVGAVLNEDSIIVSPLETTTYVLTVDEVQYSVEIIVIDNVGVSIETTKSQGYAPLAVTFKPTLVSRNSVNKFYWDFEGDGGEVDGGDGVGLAGYDMVSSATEGSREFDVTGRDMTYVYSQEGTYNARLRIVDEFGITADAAIAVSVSNKPPVVDVSVNKTNGSIPLTVNFSIKVEDNEGVADIEWDFDGDGQYDKSTIDLRVQHIYSTVGTFQTSVRVTDVSGESTIVTLPDMEIRSHEVGSQQVSMSITPNTGLAPLATSFKMGGVSGTKIEWDFDGDGEFDDNTLDSKDTSRSHVYKDPGTYFPVIKVTKATGEATFDVGKVVVEAKVLLSIEEQTIDPEDSQQAIIKTDLGSETEIQLLVFSRDNQLVRTLVDWLARGAGEYSDTWDGRNDQGKLLAPADYYVVLNYKILGKQYSLDLRDSTGGETFFPVSGVGCTRSEINPCGTLKVPDHSLEPLKNIPFVFEFTTPVVADFTAHKVVLGADDVVATFFQRRVFGQGQHEIVWNGEATNGSVLPIVTSRYLMVLMGHKLANNAIVLDHGVRVSSSRSEPVLFNPSSKAGEGKGKSKLIFDLTKESNLLLTVNDFDTGRKVLTKLISDVSAGTDVVLSWDGRNNDGYFVPTGSYLMSVEAIQKNGFRTVPVKSAVRVEY